MLRLCKIGYVAFKNVPPTGFISLGTRLCAISTRYDQRAAIQRFYSKKGDKGSKSDSEPPEKGAFQDCKTPNLYDQIPSPEKPYGPIAAATYKKNRKILIIGIIALLASLFAVYYVTNFDQISKPRKPLDKRCARGKKRKIYKDPTKSKEIPQSVPYLLIGGGTASFSAFRAIKSADPYAKVLIVAQEDQYPYMRPPLSKEIWFSDDEEAVRKLIFKQWNGAERSLYYEPPDFYLPCLTLMKSENGGVAVARGWTVKSLDVINRKVTLEDDYQIEYEKCLIATGATARNLEIFIKAPPEIRSRITTYRSICDFEVLWDVIKQTKSVAIIGGGFLGSELSCALGKYAQRKGRPSVFQIFRENGNMGKILPEYLSQWTTDKVRGEGVTVVPNSEVVDVALDKTKQVVLKLSNGKEVTVDYVIVAVGVDPNTDLAASSDLEIDPELGGYLVNSELQARSNLYIAGDCACFYDPRLGRRRVEHHDNAVVTGRLAGENMAGASKPYVHQSMFWSDLGPDVGYEAIGIVDSSLPTVGVFAKCTPKDSPKAVVDETGESDRSLTEENAKECPPSILDLKDEKEDNYGKGVIFYLRDDVVVGIVLWNVFNRMSVARQVLKDERKYEDLNEVAKLFNIHDE